MKIMKWKYQVRQILKEETAEEIENKLNQAGANGWELVGTSSLGHKENIFWVFKKPDGYVQTVVKSNHGTAGER